MYPGSRRWKVVPCCWPGVPMGCLGFLKKGSFMPQEKRFPAEARRSEEHTSELQSRPQLVCRLLLEKKNRFLITTSTPPKVDCQAILATDLHPRARSTHTSSSQETSIATDFLLGVQLSTVHSASGSH